VNQSNVYDVIVKSGFQAYDDVYRDIPADKRPPHRCCPFQLRRRPRPRRRPQVPAPAATPTTAASANTGNGQLVGLSFSDFATEALEDRRSADGKALTAKGYKVVWQEANHDVKLQNDQIDNMVTQGAKAIIVIPEDGDAAATAVDKAAKAGVKVIAYDRLIKTTNISAYISFNNTEVGRQEALEL